MPDDSLPLHIITILIIIIMLLNALVIASKRALDYIDRSIIKDSLEDEPDDPKLISVIDFISKPSKYHYADHATSYICTICAFGLVNYAVYRRFSIPLLAAFNLVFYILYTSLADILPKKLAAQSATTMGVSLVGFQRFIYVITLPLVFLCRGISNIILKLLGKKTDVDDSYFSEDKVMSMLDRGQESGEIKEEGRKMIDSIFEFDDLLAYEIMTPRTDVLMIDADDDRQEYFEELMELTHSRIPVYEDDPDNIIGILHIKDYLYNAAENGFDDIDIKSLIRPAWFVPETKNIDALFRELQVEKQHLAILIDEYGGFSGIVSVEDIIEQIVGDIDDEFDEAGRIIEKISDNEFIVDGNVYLDDLEEETGVDLESDTCETIGGFIIDLMGEIPRENIKYDPVIYENHEFTVLSVKDRRIEKIRISQIDGYPDKDGTDER